MSMLLLCSHIADGGCSMPAWREVLTTPWSVSRDLWCIAVLASTLACSARLSLGTPSMYSRVRSALGLGRFYFSLEKSLQGSAPGHANKA